MPPGNNSSNSTIDNIIVTEDVVVLVPVMLGAFLGNALVILAFIKGPRKIRTFTNYFVVNLAVSDMMVGCLSLPLWIALNLDLTSKEFNKYMMVPLDILFGVTSIYSLVAISLERLYAVKYPAKHFNLEQRRVLLAIAFIWSFGIVLFIAESIIIYYEEALNTVWVIILVSLTFAIPVITITVSYVLLHETASNLMKADNQTDTICREIRIAKTISVIISLFCICWAPFFIINLLYAFEVLQGPSNEVPASIHISKGLHYLNSMMNVFVYAIRSPDFRETFKKLIFKCGRSFQKRAYTIISMKEQVYPQKQHLNVYTQRPLNSISSDVTRTSCMASVTSDADCARSNGDNRLSDITFSSTNCIISGSGTHETQCTLLNGDNNRYSFNGDNNRFSHSGDSNRFSHNGDNNRFSNITFSETVFTDDEEKEMIS